MPHDRLAGESFVATAQAVVTSTELAGAGNGTPEIGTTLRTDADDGSSIARASPPTRVSATVYTLTVPGLAAVPVGTHAALPLDRPPRPIA